MDQPLLPGSGSGSGINHSGSTVLQFKRKSRQTFLKLFPTVYCMMQIDIKQLGPDPDTNFANFTELDTQNLK